MQLERDELHKNFVKGILEVQQKTGIKNMLLQKRVETLNNIAEHREIVIAELNATMQEPPARSNQKLEVRQLSLMPLNKIYCKI